MRRVVFFVRILNFGFVIRILFRDLIQMDIGIKYNQERFLDNKGFKKRFNKYNKNKGGLINLLIYCIYFYLFVLKKGIFDF